LLKLTSAPGETEGDFRARIVMNLREKRDSEIDKLRTKYAPRITAITDQVRRAQERIAREQSQLSQQKVNAAISVGTAILGAFFGRKALSSATLSRAGTAMRSAGRVTKESADVARAGESMEVLQQRLAGLQAELESETARLQGELDPAVATIETTVIKARKSETTTTSVALVWVPV
jgi:multidrug resistance efflux pump